MSQPKKLAQIMNSFLWNSCVTSKSKACQTDRQTDRWMDRQTEDKLSDPYMELCFAVTTKIVLSLTSRSKALYVRSCLVASSLPLMAA